MPRIPVERQGISLDVPGVSIPVGQAGAAQQGLSQLGAQMAQSSLALLDQIKQEEAKTTANKAINDDRLETDRYYQELKQRSDGGYVVDANGNPVYKSPGERKTMVEEFQEWSGKKFRDRQMSLPSQLAQSIYEQQARGFYTGKATDVMSAQQESMVNAGALRTEQMVDDSGNALVAIPRVSSAYEAINHVTKSIYDSAPTLWNVDAAAKRSEAAEQKISKDLFTGAYAQTLVGNPKKSFSRVDAARKWIEVLNEQDGDSRQRKEQGLKTVASMLQPDDKATFLRQFATLQEQAKAIDMTELRSYFKNAEAALRRDVTINVAEPLGRLQRARATNQLSEIESVDMLAGLVAAEEEQARKKNKINLLPRQAQEADAERAANRAQKLAQNLLSISPGSLAGESVREQVLAKFSADSKQEETQKQGDFAQFMEDNEPTVKATMSQINVVDPNSVKKNMSGYITASRTRDSYYKQHYGVNRSYDRELSKQKSAELGEFLSNDKNSVEARTQLISAWKRSGSRFPAIMEQMIQDKALSPKWRWVGILPSELNTQEVITVIAGADKINENFKTARTDVAEIDVRDALSKEVAPYVQATFNLDPYNPRQSEEISTLVGVVETKAKLLMTSDRSMSTNEAVRQAKESILDRNVTTVSVGGRSGFLGLGGKRGKRTDMVIPKEVKIGNQSVAIGPQQTEQIAKFIESRFQEPALKAMGVVPPKLPKGSTLSQEDFDKGFYQQIITTGHLEPTTTPEGIVFKLWYTDRTAGREVTYDGLEIPIDRVLTPDKFTETSKATNLRNLPTFGDF